MLVIWLLFVHWVADFVCQNDKMAINKSKDWFALWDHAVIYILVLFLGIVLYEGFYQYFTGNVFHWNPILVALNFPAHFITDGITSRITTWLYTKGERHWFFVVIGFDQFLHYAVLFLTI